jgi:hypothetical protein
MRFFELRDEGGAYSVKLENLEISTDLSFFSDAWFFGIFVSVIGEGMLEPLWENRSDHQHHRN